MAPVEGAWSQAQAESFLERALVPVRLGCHGAGGLWMVSLWYRYHEGAVECATASDSDLAAFLRQDDEVCFEISTNQPPYMGVRGNGSATVETDGGTALLRNLLERYLGGTGSELARWLLREEREEALLRVDPARLYTWDFTPRMADLGKAPSVTRGEPTSPKHGQPGE